MALDEPQTQEQTYSIRDMEFLIADNVLPLTRGQQLDYIVRHGQEGFTISAASACC